MTLREELIGRPAAPPRPAPYRLLAPAGWRRVPADVLTDVFGETAVERLKDADRPDLVLQMRGMLSQRVDELAKQMTHPGRGGVAEIADFLLLQTVNRAALTGIAVTGVMRYVLFLAVLGVVASGVVIEQREARHHGVESENLLGIWNVG